MNKTIKTLISITSLTAATALGWYFGKQNTLQQNTVMPKEIVAIVNDEIISKETFIQQMVLHGGLRPGQYQTLEQKQVLLDYLVNQEVVFSKAKVLGITENVAVNNLFKKKVVERYLDLELKPKLSAVKVSKNDVMMHFEHNKESYNKPARRRAAVIFVKGENNERIIEAQNKIANLDENIKHFGELAKTYSDDANSRYRGGVIGWLINHPNRKYRWDEKVTNALFSLKNNGDISPIIKADYGYYLVRLVEQEKQKKRTLSKVEKGIKNSIRQKLVKEMKTDFIDELIASSDITVNQNILESIKPLSTHSKPKQKTPPALPGSGGK